MWQANAKGHYDNEDRAHPPEKEKFKLRGRVKTDAKGAYEIETIMPGRYSIGDDEFRPAHIHYKVAADGHRPLTTQLYFKGDPHIEKDRFVKKSLVMEVAKKDGKSSVRFDIKLKKAGKANYGE